MNYNPPSEPMEHRLLPSVRGSDVKWEECENCDGTGQIDCIEEGGYYYCPKCDGKGGQWVEDMPDEKEDR